MKKITEKLTAWLRGERVTGSTICALVIGVIIAFNAIVYAFAVKYDLYLAYDKEDDLTISSASEVLFADAIERSKETGERVRIVFCRSRSQFDPQSSTYVNDATSKFYITAKQFEEKYPEFIELAYVNLLTRRMAVGDSGKEELIDLTEIQTQDGNGNYFPLYNSSVVFMSNKPGRTTRYVQDIAGAAFVLSSENSDTFSSYNGEEIIVSMALWVIADEHKNAYVTTHHGENPDITLLNMLTCAGYTIDILDLRQAELVPDNADLVVISNPTKDFETSTGGMFSEIDKLGRYVDEGGNLYVALDPYVQKLHVLEGFLDKYGIAFSEPEAQNDKKIIRHIVRDNDNAITVDGFTLVAEFADPDDEITRDATYFNGGKVIIKESAALKITDGTIARPILVSSDSSALYEGDVRTESNGGYCIAALSSFDTKNGEKSNIFVVPSVYITANDALEKKGYANRDFLYSVFDNVFGMSDVPYGCAPVYRRDAVLENLTMKMARTYTAIILTVPAVIAVGGAVLVIKRKNR